MIFDQIALSIVLVILLCTQFGVIADETKHKHHKPLVGAIVALLKGNQKGDFDGIINRNKSILKFMWKNSSVVTETNTNPDIVLFYEGELSQEMRQYIQDGTPEMKMKYVPVQFDGFGVFEDATNATAKLVNPLCIPTFWSKQFKLGYRNMCRFWFIGVFDYVQEYDWIFRLDPDCELVGPAENIMPENVMYGVSPITEHNNHHHVFISSPAWLALHRQKYDKVATTRDGDVVFGLGPFTRNFANNYGLNHSFIDSMHAPYTNAMFINLRWFRGSGHHHNIDTSVGAAGGVNNTAAAHHHDGPSHRLSHPAIIRQFLKEVDESNCIYSNRWGDMPLWGAALSLIEHPVHFLNVPYYHASHNVMIKDDSRTGFFRGDIPNMLVYADNKNTTLNTRISVLGDVVHKPQ